MTTKTFGTGSSETKFLSERGKLSNLFAVDLLLSSGFEKFKLLFEDFQNGIR